MSVLVMALVAGAILLEKYMPRPLWTARVVGLAIAAFGLASIWIPQLTTAM